ILRHERPQNLHGRIVAAQVLQQDHEIQGYLPILRHGTMRALQRPERLGVPPLMLERKPHAMRPRRCLRGSEALRAHGSQYVLRLAEAALPLQGTGQVEIDRWRWRNRKRRLAQEAFGRAPIALTEL